MSESSLAIEALVTILPMTVFAIILCKTKNVQKGATILCKQTYSEEWFVIRRTIISNKYWSTGVLVGHSDIICHGVHVIAIPPIVLLALITVKFLLARLTESYLNVSNCLLTNVFPSTSPTPYQSTTRLSLESLSEINSTRAPATSHIFYEYWKSVSYPMQYLSDCGGKRKEIY